ncbi:MAG: radical SAM protein [Bacteroidia bacterium]|nr:radical SAM protein [Bacteroidia bacterium]
MSKQINKYLATLPLFNRKTLCKAPFNALRLSLNGNIQICCANKDFLLGKYPETNIKTAWFSEKVNELRKCISSKDLSLGCSECKSQIENGAFYSVKARFYNHLKINKNGYPSLIEFELDNNCNLECIMCNPYTSSSILNKCNFQLEKTQYNNSIINEIEEFIPHLTHANFIGGEPFLVPLYFSIIEKMLSINPKIIFNISTNGTILNNRIKELLTKGNFDIGFSIDSIRKDTYEKIRINASFDIVMDNLDYFQNYCKSKGTSFSVWVCPLKQNAYEIAEFVNYFEKRNIKVYFNTVIMPHSLSLWYQNSFYLKKLHAFYNKLQISGKSENYKRFIEFINQIGSWAEASIYREKYLSKYSILNNDELINIFVENVRQHIIKNDETKYYSEEIKSIINSILIQKSEKQLKNILLFLLSLPTSESIEILMSNNIEYINYYISKNF